MPVSQPYDCRKENLQGRLVDHPQGYLLFGGSPDKT